MPSLLSHSRAKTPDPIADALQRVNEGDIVELGTTKQLFTRPETFIVTEVTERPSLGTPTGMSCRSSANTQTVDSISLLGPYDDQYSIDLRPSQSPISHRPVELVARPTSGGASRQSRHSKSYGAVEYLTLMNDT